MTSPVIERLRELLEKGTPGPWHCTYYEGEPVEMDIDIEGVSWPLGELNYPLIVAMHEALPALLDAADLLRRLNEWDAWDMADKWPLGDAPYWKREISRALQALDSGEGEGGA